MPDAPPHQTQLLIVEFDRDQVGVLIFEKAAGEIRVGMVWEQSPKNRDGCKAGGDPLRLASVETGIFVKRSSPDDFCQTPSHPSSLAVIRLGV